MRHDHYHHIVDPNQSSYDSSSDTSSYADSDTTPDNTCIDANHDGQCDATEVSPPDGEPCQDISQDNGIADASSCRNSNDADSSSDCGGDSGGGGEEFHFQPTTTAGIYHNPADIARWLTYPSELELVPANYSLLPLARGKKLADFITLCFKEGLLNYL